MYQKLAIVVFACITIIHCEKNCDSGLISCVEKELIGYVDELEKTDHVGGFLVLEKTREIPRKQNLEENIVDRCLRYLEEHELRIRMPTSEARSFIAEGRSNRLRKMLLPILLVLKLKLAVIFPIILSIVGFVAFSGLGAGLTALVIAGATALKGVLESHHSHSKISYEFVPQLAPWSRSGVEPNIAISPLSAGYHTMD